MVNKEKQIQEFWNYFVLNNQNFRFVDSDISIAQDQHFIHLGKLLKQINENLTFEIGPCIEGHGELTLSADGIEAAFTYIDTLYKNKPKLDNWVIYKFRQPLLDIENFSISIEKIEFQFCEIFFQIIEEQGKLIIALFLPGYKEDEPAYEIIKFLILDACLGEYDAVMKVAYCAGYNLDHHKNLALKPIKFLKEDFDGIYRSKVN